jgi:hypothetical protein
VETRKKSNFVVHEWGETLLSMSRILPPPSLPPPLPLSPSSSCRDPESRGIVHSAAEQYSREGGSASNPECWPARSHATAS